MLGLSFYTGSKFQFDEGKPVGRPLAEGIIQMLRAMARYKVLRTIYQSGRSR